MQKRPAIQSLRMRLYLLLRTSPANAADQRLQHSRTILHGLLDDFVVHDRFVNEESAHDYLQLLRLERLFLSDGKSMRGHLLDNMVGEIEQSYRLREIEEADAKAA